MPELSQATQSKGRIIVRSFFTKSLEVICQIAIVLLFIFGLVGGWNTSGFLGAIGGLLGALLFSAMFFGALFILMDIADHTKRAADALENR